MAETLTVEVSLLRKQCKEQEDLLKARKTHKRGKRVRLEGVHVFSTQQVLEIAREAEAERPAKRSRGRPRKRPVVEKEQEDEDEVSEYSHTTSEDELALVVRRRKRSQ